VSAFSAWELALQIGLFRMRPVLLQRCVQRDLRPVLVPTGLTGKTGQPMLFQAPSAQNRATTPLVWQRKAMTLKETFANNENTVVPNWTSPFF
jgi:hypothetical protein